MQKWIYALLALWLVGCSTDSDDGLTEDERRSKEIWTITGINSGLWDTYTPVPEDFTVFSDSALVQEFLDLNGLSPTLTVRDVARPEKGGTRFKSIRLKLDSIVLAHDSLIIPESWSAMQPSEFEVIGARIKGIKGLANIKTLQVLVVMNTYISEVPVEIVNFDLVMLALGGNEIKLFPEWLVDYVDSNQTVLGLSDNLISSAPNNLARKHWSIVLFGNKICDLSVEDSTALWEWTRKGSGFYKIPSEYLNEPALSFYPQNCE